MTSVFSRYVNIAGFSITAIVYFILSIIFASCLHETKPNGTFGIRIPKTYFYPEVWERVHRFTSIIMTAFLPAQFLMIFFFRGWAKFALCNALLIIPCFLGIIN